MDTGCTRVNPLEMAGGGIDERIIAQLGCRSLVSFVARDSYRQSCQYMILLPKKQLLHIGNPLVALPDHGVLLTPHR